MRVKMPMSSIEFVVHAAFFHHITCYYHTYTTNFGEISDIIKGDTDNNEGVLGYENRFQTFRWQYQGVL